MASFPSGVHLVGGIMAGIGHAASARAFNGPLVRVVAELHGQGLSLRAIAAELDRRGFKTRQGRRGFSPTQVRRLLARVPAADAGPPSDRRVPAAGDGAV
jgi:hypothetical protein